MPTAWTDRSSLSIRPKRLNKKRQNSSSANPLLEKDCDDPVKIPGITALLLSVALRAGIEPALAVPETAVLSVERSKHLPVEAMYVLR